MFASNATSHSDQRYVTAGKISDVRDPSDQAAPLPKSLASKDTVTKLIEEIQTALFKLGDFEKARKLLAPYIDITNPPSVKVIGDNSFAVQSTLLLCAAQLNQFQGTKQLRREKGYGWFLPASSRLSFKKQATACFGQAELCLNKALEAAEESKDSFQINTIKLQQLQTRRARVAEDLSLDETLQEDFESFREELMTAGQMPGAVAFIYWIGGNLTEAQQRYKKAIEAEETPLHHARYGQVLAALAENDLEAIKHLKIGLKDLGWFPEKSDIQACLRRTQRRLWYKNTVKFFAS